MLKILQTMLQQYVNEELPDVKAGFRKGRGIRDQIFYIGCIIGKHKRILEKIIYFCFIDYTKAFNYVNQFSHSVMSDSLCPYGLQHTRLPCPSPTPKAYSNFCPLSPWCHPTISFSDIQFSSCLQSFPASGSFPMSQFLTSGGQSIGASASVLPMSIRDWFPLGWTGWISLQSKGFSRVFSSTTVQRPQFYALTFFLLGALTSIYDCWKNHSFDNMDFCNVSAF